LHIRYKMPERAESRRMSDSSSPNRLSASSSALTRFSNCALSPVSICISSTTATTYHLVSTALSGRSSCNTAPHNHMIRPLHALYPIELLKQCPVEMGKGKNTCAWWACSRRSLSCRWAMQCSRMPSTSFSFCMRRSAAVAVCPSLSAAIWATHTPALLLSWHLMDSHQPYMEFLNLLLSHHATAGEPCIHVGENELTWDTRSARHSHFSNSASRASAASCACLVLSTCAWRSCTSSTF
jgi:hypothetical protein